MALPRSSRALLTATRALGLETSPLLCNLSRTTQTATITPSALQGRRWNTKAAASPSTAVTPAKTTNSTQSRTFQHDAKEGASIDPVHIEPRDFPVPTPDPARIIGRKRFADFDLKGRVFIITGGARGLGLSLAEGLVEAGGKVYCFDREPKPDAQWDRALSRVVPEWGGSLHYVQQDVSDTAELDAAITRVAETHERLDGVIAAAAIQQVTPAADYNVSDAERMLSVNCTAVMMTATAAARQMKRYGCQGSICFIASMSGTIANKGMISPVYNASKAAVIQLARNLAMEWGPLKPGGGGGGIRVNCLSPGHIETPMVEAIFQKTPEVRTTWENENMLGRLSHPSEFKGAALFLMSNASTFMTGANMIIDGGHTAW